VSRVFGLDRGGAVDRWYIERFLAEHAALIRGRTLEVGETSYTTRFGGERIERADALVFGTEDGDGRLAGDLTEFERLPEQRYDCFVCTQTLNFIFDVRAAVRGAHRLLKPGGVLLATVAGISPISRFDLERWGDYWRFTPLALEKLLGAEFSGGVEVRGRGNLLAATAFLHGMAVEDLDDRAALEFDDPDYPLIVTAVARRAS
jgi:SAM-dependent methyltransferase